MIMTLNLDVQKTREEDILIILYHFNTLHIVY